MNKITCQELQRKLQDLFEQKPKIEQASRAEFTQETIFESHAFLEKIALETRDLEVIFDKLLAHVGFRNLIAKKEGFKYVGVFHKGLAPASQDGNKYFFVDLEGKRVSARNFKGIGKFCQNRARVFLDDSSSTIVNELGEPLHNPDFGGFSFARVDEYSYGYASVKNGNMQSVDTLDSFVDLNGTMVFNNYFESARKFCDGFAAVVARNSGGMWHFINTQGKKMSEEFEEVGDFCEGLARVKNGKWYFIDTNMQKVGGATFSEAEDFSEGFAPVLGDIFGAYFYIDKTGMEMFGGKIFDEARKFSCGRAFVKKRKKYYCIDTTGERAFDDDFDDVRDFCDGYASVKNGKGYFHIDIHGKRMTDELFDESYEFEDGVAKVQQRGVVFYINVQGQRLFSN